MEKLCWKRKAFKALSFGKGPSTAGRNFSGSITIFHRGGGVKRLLRRIDFERKNLARGVVERIEYDPNRTARIALIRWSNIQLNNWKEHHNYNEASSSESISFKVRRFFSYSRMEQILGRVFFLQQSLKQATRASTNLNFKELTTSESIKNKNGFTKKAQSTYVCHGNLMSSLNLIKKKNFVKSRKHLQNYTLTNSMGWSSRMTTNSVQTAFSYILACNGLKPGDEVFNINNVSSDKWPFGQLDKEFQSNFSEIYPVEQLYEKSGISLPLWLAPLGSPIHNIELYPGEGGKLVRAAGACAQLVQKPLKERSYNQRYWANAPLGTVLHSTKEVCFDPSLEAASIAFIEPGPHKSLPTVYDKSTRDNDSGQIVGIHTKDAYMCTIRLPSGQQQLLDLRCRATIGACGNIDHNRRVLKKAGQRRWLGFRPVVRGVAMNPIDHPHGGGEGRTKGGRPSVSPWGKPAKGAKPINPMAKRRATKRKRG